MNINERIKSIYPELLKDVKENRISYLIFFISIISPIFLLFGFVLFSPATSVTGIYDFALLFFTLILLILLYAIYLLLSFSISYIFNKIFSVIYNAKYENKLINSVKFLHIIYLIFISILTSVFVYSQIEQIPFTDYDKISFITHSIIVFISIPFLYFSVIYIVSALETAYVFYNEKRKLSNYEYNKNKILKSLIVAILNSLLIILIYAVSTYFFKNSEDIEGIILLKNLSLVFKGFAYLIYIFLPMFIFSKIIFYKREPEISLRLVLFLILALFVSFVLKGKPIDELIEYILFQNFDLTTSVSIYWKIILITFVIFLILRILYSVFEKNRIQLRNNG